MALAWQIEQFLSSKKPCFEDRIAKHILLMDAHWNVWHQQLVKIQSMVMNM